VGVREALIDRAVAILAREGDVHVVARSPLYESLPAGGPPQGDYLNAAVLVETSLEPLALLERALSVERELGRIRRERWGPRTIDLDVLWIEGRSVSEPGLQVPHPQLEERPFALRPLLDVTPDATDPRTGRAYASCPAASSPLRLYRVTPDL